MGSRVLFEYKLRPVIVSRGTRFYAVHPFLDLCSADGPAYVRRVESGQHTHQCSDGRELHRPRQQRASAGVAGPLPSRGDRLHLPRTKSQPRQRDRLRKLDLRHARVGGLMGCGCAGARVPSPPSMPARLSFPPFWRPARPLARRLRSGWPTGTARMHRGREPWHTSTAGRGAMTCRMWLISGPALTPPLPQRHHRHQPHRR